MLGNLFRFCFCVWIMKIFFSLSGQLKSDYLFLPTPEPPTWLSFWRKRGFSISFSKELISNENSRDENKSIPFKQLPTCRRILGFYFLFRKEGEGVGRRETRKGGTDLKEMKLGKGKHREVKWAKQTREMGP